MEDPARNDEDSDASTYSSSESEQEQQQGDLVVQGFASLCKNYNPGKYHVEFFYLLREQTNTFRIDAQAAYRLIQKPTLELILDTQSERWTLQRFKGFRMFGLDNRFRGLLHPTTSLFEQSQKLIRQLELSTEESQSTSSNISDSEEVQSPDQYCLNQKQIINSACCSSNAAKLLKLISLPDDSEGDDGLSDDHITPPSELTIQLAYQVLPTIKLSRLFCKKIITNGLNSKRCPLCTDLSSKQLTDLSDLSGEVATLVSFLWGNSKCFVIGLPFLALLTVFGTRRTCSKGG
ncbi:hypothetical protein PSHT_01699 [Puccinia striiformis]|uniref:Uncharacterized protein n=1 Tax=Puccinia striiformis TaxID=27350 RepID=A0A2S4WJX9_9BASI|nr:hypothetical protein PSHT_01699 [Puccinia striiformis]